jgi:octaprenyl-diphosphate synthase
MGDLPFLEKPVLSRCMAANSSQKPATDARSSPLETLSALLEPDMKSVNALILRHMDSPVTLIPQLAGYLIAAGGKRVRPLLTLAATQIYSGDMNRAHGLAAAVEFIHSATLLHDDVVDESAQRRGRDTANIVFGNQASVLVGDFLFSRAFQLMVTDGSLDVLRILSNASAIIAQGEVMQLAATGNLATTIDDYLEIIKAKTAALFAAACEVGPVISGAGHDAAQAMAEYGMNLGIAFQIADDALDYDADQEKLGKTIGDDFREGKMTAPVIIALQNADAEEKKFWARTIAEKSQDDSDLQQAQAILQRHNATKGALTLAQDYAERAQLALAEAPDHALRALLDTLCRFVVDRGH